MTASVKFGPILSDNGYSRFNDDILINQTATLNDVDITVTNARTRGSINNDHNVRPDHEVELPNVSDYLTDGVNWEMNYHEAAIYLEEGANNDKFDSHPHETKQLPAYLLVHNTWYYSLDLFTSLVLLSLALGEEPAVPAFELPVVLHSLIEILALTIIAVELAMKLRWIGWWTILKHKRTMLKGATLFVMFIEAVVVLVRQTSHFRITRSLRPIFLVDTHHLGGVRRFIRQIFQSLPPIIDMLLLILFFVVIYSVLGFFLFSANPRDHYFVTLYDSIVSMFVLLTTANFPDIMMPSYAINRWYSLFFISYLCIVLYILMNMMLAVVYEVFTTLEKEKMKKLYLHKHKACQLAFKLLTRKSDPNKLYFRHFHGLMRYYAPKMSDRNAVIIFKYLNTNNNGYLSIDEFYKVYDAVIMKWHAQYANIPWYHSTWMPLQNVCQMANNLISTDYFEYFFQFMTITNLMIMADIAIYNFDSSDLVQSAYFLSGCWDALFFAFIFSIEVLIKMLAMGVKEYFKSGWNIFDFVATVLAGAGYLILNIWSNLVYVAIFRAIKVFKLFKMKKRYRDIIGTVALLMPLIKSAFIVMMVVYYFFAIIGMELFSGYDMKDCCKGTAVEDFYQYRKANNSDAVGYYYLNTFQNMAVSLVTLFELTVVNNWFIVMNSYGSVVHPATRIYFMMFYLFTMIVLTIVVASILEAFRFRIQYKRQTTKKDEEKMLHEEVHLNWDDVMSLIQDFSTLEKIRPELVVGGTVTFIGVRPRSREVLQQRMYKTEIEAWLNEADSHN